MEPLDVAYKTFCVLAESISPDYWDSIVTEADTRMKLIDKVFVQVLGWPDKDIHLEDAAGEKRIDYRFTIDSLNRLIVEAKRKGRDLGISPDYKARGFRLDGSVFKTEAAQEGINQTIHYCMYRGAELACVTNGHQWLVFRGNRAADGTDVLKGTAIVFGSLDAVKVKFSKFYDLLSFESVADFRYRALFQEEEGQPIRSKSFRASVRTRESRQFLKRGKISVDIDRVMTTFFEDLSGEDEADTRRECFVTTTESTTAEESIVRISEELRGQIRAIASSEGSEITDAIRRVQDMNRREMVLLVGTKGSGKSTFIERFFSDVMPLELQEDCRILRIDLADCGCDSSTIINWLDANFLKVTEAAVFAGRPPSYDELQGMYWWEYGLWRDGHAKHLYDTDKTQFKIEFGKHIAKRREERPNEYITHMLARIVKGLEKVPCLIFDNADHFDVPFQEEVFKYAHALYRSCLCLAVVPITDTTSWQLARHGPMQSFFTESFFLPSPPTDVVLRKRIEYLEKCLSEKPPERGRGYYFSNFTLEIDNIRGFAACLQTVFINTGQVADWIGALANHDIRRCLRLTREIISSPHISMENLLKAYVGKKTLSVSPDEVKMAIVRSAYDIYPSNDTSFVQNLFAFVPELDTTPLIAIRALQFLEMVWEGNSAADSRYATTDSVIQYLKSMNTEPRATKTCLKAMLDTGLVLSYDPTARKIEEAEKIQISPSGRQHLAWAQQDWVYLESMAEVTPLLDPEAVGYIRENMNSGTAQGRRSAIQRFIRYLLDEDEHYCITPKHEYYTSQVAIRRRLHQQVRALGSTTGVMNASRRYGRTVGQVIRWVSDEEFGFIRQADGSEDAFVHINDVVSSTAGRLEVGAHVEYDLLPRADRPKATKVVVLDEDK